MSEVSNNPYRLHILKWHEPMQVRRYRIVYQEYLGQIAQAAEKARAACQKGAECCLALTVTSFEPAQRVGSSYVTLEGECINAECPDPELAASSALGTVDPLTEVVQEAL